MPKNLALCAAAHLPRTRPVAEVAVAVDAATTGTTTPPPPAAAAVTSTTVYNYG